MRAARVGDGATARMVTEAGGIPPFLFVPRRKSLPSAFLSISKVLLMAESLLIFF
jgi:hypothetical protein